MKTSKPFGQSLFQNGVSLFILFNLVNTYLEPGATSFILKVIISALAGIAVAFRYIKGAFQVLFSKTVRDKQTDEQKEKEEDP